MPSATEERRRIAIIDGAERWDLSLPLSARLDSVLHRLGVDAVGEGRMLVSPSGAEIELDREIGSLGDGDVLAVIDLGERVVAPRRRRDRTETVTSTSSITWIAATAGILAAVLALLLPGSLDPMARLVATGVLALSAIASAVATSRHTGIVSAVAPLAFAFAAGVGAVPLLPAATTQAAVLTGLLAAAVVAGLLALLARSGSMRAGVATGTVLLLVLAGIWGLTLLVGLDATAASALTLGLTPVALRILPTTLLDVPPGMFIDYERYQTTRWSVRQQLPEPGVSVRLAAVRGLVDASSARLLVGTAIVCTAAALGAPTAVSGFSRDGIVLGGQIGLLVCVALALIFGARRYAVPALQWLPRAAALVVIGTGVVAITRLGDVGWVLLIAAVALGAGVATGAAVIPISRGARSLSWSRFADVLEGMTVALALPAGLLAAGVIDLLRGMMTS
ncbi:hypothetical protein [Schumannella soli]|uniref:Type VII secretion integral membrane protein EccD n=1 Tax=Schumannella soli TaxID=2590779 RepID=A0A506Y7J5_9MICO|nr:hypothetical protein [Schumannella soli]TPW77843.1 hypothetical protein FJ657_04135 [Schumannella soli]